MTVQEATYELLGTIADSSCVLGIDQKSMHALAEILKKIGVETSAGSDYQKPHIITRKACEHFLAKAKKANDTADNIQKHFTKNDGSPL
jgi:hypothetical protein